MSIATMKAELTAVVENVVAGRKVSDILKDRANRLLAVSSKYYNEETLDNDIIEKVIETFKANPELGSHDMTVVDGVIYPVIMDEEEGNQVIDSLGEMLGLYEPHQSATLAFVIRWTSEGYFKAA